MDRRPWLSVVVALSAYSVHPVLAENESAQAAPPATIEYSLLQPGLTGEYYVGTAMDVTVLGSGFGNVKRTAALREAVQAANYDPTAKLAQAMQAELERAGSRTVIEPVHRGPVGKPYKLSRADLPAQPAGRYLIDLEIAQLGLAAEANLAPWEPYFNIRWRVLNPQGEPVVATRLYRYGPYASFETRNAPRTLDCGLPPFADAIKTTAVFDCLDRGLRDAAAALVPQLREAQSQAGVK